MKQLNLGVVGYGNRGADRRACGRSRRTRPRLRSHGYSAPRGRNRAIAKFGDDTLVTDSLDALIDHAPDAVFVTSPDFAHAEHAVALLDAGIPVFVDKPLAITVEDADRILEAAHRTGTKLYVGHNMRHSPAIRLMKSIIDSGRIGKVMAVWCRHFIGDGGDRFFKDWHSERSKVNSLLLQKGAHDIDVIHWLAGGYSRRVTAMGGLTLYGDVADRAPADGSRLISDWLNRDKNWPPRANTGLNPVIDVEDISMLQMRLDNGVLASYQQCHFTPDYWRNYTVIGDEGRIENFGLGGDGCVRIWDRRTEFKEHGDEEIPIPQVEGGHHGADPALLAEFLRFVRDGVPTETSPVAAREAVAAGAQAADSLRHGAAPRDVPPLPEHLRAYFDEGQRSPQSNPA